MTVVRDRPGTAPPRLHRDTARWAWGLGKPGFESAPFRAFNENLVRDFLAPAR